MAYALTTQAPALAATALAALAGGAAVGGLGAPAGWLSGAMLGVAVLAAFGRAAPLPKPVQRLTVLLAGVGMGSGLTPATLHTLARYPLSLVVLAVAIAAMTAASYATLTRAEGFSRQTAFYSAVPGALSYVFLVASRTEADLARVAVIQVFRIFVLMAVVPMVARLGVGTANVRFLADPLGATAVLLALGALGGARWSAGACRTACFTRASSSLSPRMGRALRRGGWRRDCRSRRRPWSAPGSAPASSASTGDCCGACWSRR